MKFKFAVAVAAMVLGYSGVSAQAVDRLAARVTEGTSVGKIEFVEVNDGVSADDWFRITATPAGKIRIEGNNDISMAVGFNHYLKNIAAIHIAWNNLTSPLPDKLPHPSDTIFRSTHLKQRYYLNYCTFSYSMPFWDEERWMKEIDWMALHGVNMALSITGMEAVWKNLLEKYGYTQDEINAYIPGPAYMAWWQMNNLEGWGGPLPESRYARQETLQRKIVARMKELGIAPIFPGYSGMIPSTFKEKTGNVVADMGLWCGFQRPALITSSDSLFNDVADNYYAVLDSLYGRADYYSIDPFHEGGDLGNVDVAKVGRMIYDAMKRNNSEAKWVIQGWQSNPRKGILDTVPSEELLVLDLYSEKIPRWEMGEGYGKHDWLYCMLLNFGGNVGMHGRVNSLIHTFEQARHSEKSPRLRGVGATPEGIENNPMMYELLFDLPWASSIDFDAWLKGYLTARYGKEPDENVASAWRKIVNTVYNAPVNYPGEGTVESIICARPSWAPRSASTWGNSTLFYSPDSTRQAARLMHLSREKYAGNDNFLYDLIDISRQANADEANRLMMKMSALRSQWSVQDSCTSMRSRALINNLSEQFLNLILRQDSLLSILPDTRVDTWLDAAGSNAGDDSDARRLYRENVATLITVWGDSVAANYGGLHDYSHREWGGIIKELYYQRWKAFFDHELRGAPAPDYYRMEKTWIRRRLAE